MPETKQKEMSTITRSHKEVSEDGSVTIKDKLSIQQILEGMTNEFNKPGTKKQILDGMTNEFNKTGTKKQVEPVKKTHCKTESPMRKQEKIQFKVSEDIPKTSKVVKVSKSSNQDEEVKIIKENIPEEKIEKTINGDDSSSKQETGNKNRIVLTFKTIDENTDHGKKTKISSVPSNLSLVPDELVHCNQIGGVSVRIENDEASHDLNKSQAKDNQKQTNKKFPKLLTKQTEETNKKSSKLINKQIEETNKKSPKSTNKQMEETNKKSPKLINKQLEEKKEQKIIEKEINNLNENMEISSFDENQKDNNVSVLSEPEKLESKNLPSRRLKTKRLKESINSHEIGLKRSARRLSKESLKSTVLESAMARKEKSNYTAETIKRKYTKPGRPKKLLPEKTDIPKLNPIDPSKFNSDKKPALPKLCPLKKSIPSLKKIVPNNNDNSTSLDNLQKFNKYEGMPKLTPIIKSCEIIHPRIFQTDDTTNDNSAVKDLNEIFLKPIPKKTNQDKNRSRALKLIELSKKIANRSRKESSPSSTDSGALMDDSLEDNPTPPKKTRRNMTSSPSTAEGSASKPESAAVLNDKEDDNSIPAEDMQCLCETRSQLFVTITSTDTPLYCTALDSIDNRTVGCCNEVDNDDVAMRRPSSRIPYIILCRMHKDRLIKHNCCPTCGLFCSQGKFIHCSNGHQYHRNCELIYEDKPLCPHCGSYGLSYDVMITLTGKRKPSSTLAQKFTRTEPTAKITLPGLGDNTRLAEQQPVLKKSTEPLIDPSIEIPFPTDNEKGERYTYPALYHAAKNGDVQKLVNILANGFNVNHTFRDQGHRTSLHVAAEKGFLICVHVLVQAGAQLDVMDRNQLTPVMLASLSGEAEIVKYLMRVGADVTLKGEDGMSALHMAAKNGHLETCKTMLSECKVPRTLVDAVDDGGWTSLIWACEFRHADVARFLLDNKCDPLIRDAEQNIALHWSAYSGSSEITELLLDLGSDPGAVNVHGDTPLHIASRQDQYAVSVLLLSRGAKIGEVNTMGETAIDCCGGTGDTLRALQLNFKLNQRIDSMSERTVRILTNDISRGKETNPVQCVNAYDNEDKPTDFVYITDNCFTSKVNIDRSITSLQSCRCEDTCNKDRCLCGNISLRCWYDDEGKLVPEFNYTDPPMIFECNPACDCNKITCNNRVVQHGLTQRFQLFRTEDKGWGIKTLRHISKGSYVCEYIGEIISDSEADVREDDSYLFDLDNRDGETYCIDARRYGNLARFINHACAPNLLPVRIFIEHQDLHFPRIAFFANQDIEADEELGFDYGEKFWIIKCKSFTCTCGAENCRYSDKTIQDTLNNYRQKIQQEEVAAQALKTQKT